MSTTEAEGVSPLVEQARAIGVAMGSRLAGRQIGWTRDGEKADACRALGLTVLSCPDSKGMPGWEISAVVGVEPDVPSL